VGGLASGWVGVAQGGWVVLGGFSDRTWGQPVVLCIGFAAGLGLTGSGTALGWVGVLVSADEP